MYPQKNVILPKIIKTNFSQKSLPKNHSNVMLLSTSTFSRFKQILKYCNRSSHYLGSLNLKDFNEMPS